MRTVDEIEADFEQIRDGGSTLIELMLELLFILVRRYDDGVVHTPVDGDDLPDSGPGERGEG